MLLLLLLLVVGEEDDVKKYKKKKKKKQFFFGCVHFLPCDLLESHIFYIYIRKVHPRYMLQKTGKRQGSGAKEPAAGVSGVASTSVEMI